MSRKQRIATLAIEPTPYTCTAGLRIKYLVWNGATTLTCLHYGTVAVIDLEDVLAEVFPETQEVSCDKIVFQLSPTVVEAGNLIEQAVLVAEVIVFVTAST